jgi:hypothetical protein
LKFATKKKMIKKVPPHILFVCQTMISYAHKNNSSDDNNIIEVYYEAQL